MKLIAAVLALFAVVQAAPSPRELAYARYAATGGLPLPEAVREAHPEWVDEILEYAAKNGSRIVGGSASAAGAIPWAVSVRQSSHFCGASIYNTRTVICAAHCTTGVSSVSIRYNSLTHASGGTLVTSSGITNHASYSSSTLNNDVSVIRLSAALTLGQTQARAVGMPAQGSDPATSASSIAAGWGTTSESGSLAAALRQVTLPIVSRASCQSAYGSSQVTTNMVCAGVTAGGIDSCQGDSGGPLTVSGVLIGIVSWGIGCARPNYPGVYTRVGNYVSWIASNAG